MQPGRIVVVNGSLDKSYARAMGLTKAKQGRLRGKYARTFNPGEIARADALELKFKLQDDGIAAAVEYQGKQYPECTMYCNTPHHPTHTQECMKRRGEEGC